MSVKDKVFAALDDSVSKEDFLKSFQAAMTHLITFEKQLNAKVDTKLSNITAFEEDYKQLVTRVREDKNLTFDQLKQDVAAHLEGLFQEHANALNFLRDTARKIKPGVDGKTPVKGVDYFDGQPGKTPVLGEDYTVPTAEEVATLVEVPDEETPQSLRDKLQSLKGEERLDVSAIKGLEERLAKLPKPQTAIAYSRGQIKMYDLSPLLDGVKSTFSLPAFWRVIDVKLSSLPVMLPTTDYTIDGSLMKITFTSQVQAATDLAAGQSCIIIYAEP